MAAKKKVFTHTEDVLKLACLDIARDLAKVNGASDKLKAEKVVGEAKTLYAWVKEK